MWFQVVFYGLLINAVLSIIIPDKVTPKDFICSALPLFSNEYWYFTAYFLVCLLSPLVNNAVRTLSESTLRKTVIVIVFFFSIFSIFSNSSGIIQSFSFPWIFILYFLGAVIKRCRIGEKISSFKLVFCIFLCAAISFIWAMFTWISEINVLRSTWTDYMLVKHISPTMLFPAICYLLLFRRINVGDKAKKAVKFLSPCVFATYLINTHQIIYSVVLHDIFVPLTGLNIAVILLFVFAFSILFVLSSCLIDKVRILLFKLIRLDKLAAILGNLAGKVMEQLSKKI